LASKSTSLTAGRIVDELKKCGITHIVWLPDTESQFVCEAVIGQPDFQNTGFLESGDSIRSLALDLRLPLLLLIGYRGWHRDSPITDSAAIFTEPILEAWGIRYYLVETDEDVEKISLGYKEAHETRQPVVILLGGGYEES